MERFDYGKRFILKTIIRNDRLDTYDKYIKYALSKGYEVGTLEGMYNNRQSTEKYLALRHDVDYITLATKKMFEHEKKIGVKSTYYFRKTTLDIDLIKEMEAAGFEVGFHFETIADYVIENNLEKLGEEDLQKCKERLKAEIEEQKKIYKLRSICSHGAPENVKIGVSNNVLTEGEDYSYYGILFEAYDKDMYRNVDVHIMDDNIRHGSGFAYASNPIDAINSDAKKIVFLSHPNHWYETFKDKLHNLICIVLGKYYNESKREFKRIASI